MFRHCAVLVISVASVGVLPACLASRSNQPDAAAEAARAESRARARKDRRRIRDLQRELDKVKSKSIAQNETRSRPSAEATKPAAAREAAEPNYEVVGVDEDGVEIVYVGEAAQESTIRPVLSNDDAPRLRELPVATPVRSPATQPRISNTPEIPVMSGPVPRISAATKRPAPKLAGPKLDYQAAMDALRARRHSDAESAFRQFLSRYPKHDFADNAQYWLGETFYDRKLYADALAHFQRVIKRYPKGNKVAAALLKSAYCYLALGNNNQARSALSRVVKEHANSAPAKLAGKRLQEF